MDKKEKIYFIISIIFIVIMTISSIIKQSYKFLYLVIFIIIFLIIYFVIFSISCTSYKRIFKTHLKHYNYLKQKETRTGFDELYMLVFQNKAESILKDKLKMKKVKEINELDFEIDNVNKIKMSFYHNYYKIEIIIKDDLIEYLIDTPSKYNYLDDNKEFEKKRYIDINKDEITCTDDYFDLFVALINQIKEVTKEFSLTHPVDNFINGQLLEKFSHASNYLKTEGYVGCIFGPIFTVFFLVIMIVCFCDVDYLTDNPLGYYTALIVCLSFVLLFVIITIYAANSLKRYFNIKTDIKNKNITKIKGNLKKVRVVMDQPSRHSKIRTLRFIKLYYEQCTLYVPFTSYKFVESTKNLKTFYQECMKINQQITYLSNSKIVISGGERFLSLAKNILTIKNKFTYSFDNLLQNLI